MLYQISNGSVSFGADTVLENINFEIKNNENIAIVGRNGCGKSTLLKLIAGEIDFVKRDSDENVFIAKAGNPSIGYLKQMAFSDEGITLEEEIRKIFIPIIELKKEVEERLRIMEEDPSEINVKRYTTVHDRFTDMGGYNYEKDYEIMYTKFGFKDEDRYKKLSEFSGGQKTRIAFVKLLLSQPDILLLDEPTNHLDITTIEWLEDYLCNYKKAVVVVSHDRMFLDKVVDVVYEIEYGVTKRYSGNYSFFCERKQENYDKQLKDYNRQQKEIQRIEKVIDRFKGKPSKVSMAHSKEKYLEHMEKIESPDMADNKTFHINVEPEITSGKEVLVTKDLSIGYDKPLTNVNLTITRGQKVGIIGANGTGKSTFLKTIMGMLDGLSGSYKYGINVTVGYFDQQTAQYSSNKTVIDDYWDEYPNLTQTEVRNSLGAFLFTQDDVFKNVDMLSGGEKSRLALSKMLRKRPNFLILDEPTNHMDIVGKETLEKILKEYTGTLLFVSHDRYFIKQVADVIVSFENGATKVYPFGYEQYKEEISKQNITNISISEVKKDNNKPMSKEKEKMILQKEQQKKQRRADKIEGLIAEIELKIEALKEELNKPEYAADYVKLQEINDNIGKHEDEIAGLMEEWEILLSEIEE